MIYLDLFRALQANQVRYLLVGGLAMNLHGVPRMTMDVDLILSMDDENLDRFIACAHALSLTPTAPVSLQAIKDANQRRFWVEQKNMVAFGLQNNQARIPIIVDILVAPNIELEAAYHRSLRRTLEDVEVCFASIEDMISLKRSTGRAQDESDITHLERIRDR